MSGTRARDSLSLVFARQGGGGFRFTGAYRTGRQVLSGVLDGDEFHAMAVVFRNR